MVYTKEAGLLQRFCQLRGKKLWRLGAAYVLLALLFHLPSNSRASFSILNCNETLYLISNSDYKYRTHSAVVEAISKVCEARLRYSFILALDGHNLYFTHGKSLRPSCSNIQWEKICLYPLKNYIMQPPDGGSWSFKQAFAAESECGRVTNRRKFFSIFCSCYRVTATEKIKSFLRTIEIYSFKSEVFIVKEFEFTAKENWPKPSKKSEENLSQIITEDSQFLLLSTVFALPRVTR